MGGGRYRGYSALAGERNGQRVVVYVCECTSSVRYLCAQVCACVGICAGLKLLLQLILNLQGGGGRVRGRGHCSAKQGVTIAARCAAV